jgi:hypothetical protein
MQFQARLDGETAALARDHAEVMRRLPATVHAFILVEMQKWATLFPAERRYQRALLEHLAGTAAGELTRLSAGIARVEAEASLSRISERDPARFQDLAQAALRKQSLVPAWRREIDLFFQQIDPRLESRLYPPDAPRRLVVQLYSRDIAVQPEKLWSRLRAQGTRIPLSLAGVKNREGYLRALLGAASDDHQTSLFGRLQADATFAPTDSWIVESNAALHDLLAPSAKPGLPAALSASPLAKAEAPSEKAGAPLARRSAEREGGSPGSRYVTGLSYERLLPYRDVLMKALFSKVQDGVESPQAFAAYARSLTLAPEPGTLPNPDAIIQAFVRDVLLTGNGTLFVNNTFVEWAAVQALRRAQPRLLVARYGVRDRLKPFSSLLLFSQPRATDRIPLIEDPLGSFIDVEQLSYYVWLQAEKSAAYRKKTLYLFLAESQDEMLAIRSDAPGPAVSTQSPASLADVCATMAEWLGLQAAEGLGRPIAALVG